ncbi:hypothetical protein R1sor_004775 [Riccia sorocarpa]|uniref:Nucleotide-diphospho-sugar transferase domain-containing protein n=1 Tax=Riccia sorocarpa TaxID=122646 RepID=A0ABD3HL63_9MARC
MDYRILWLLWASGLLFLGTAFYASTLIPLPWVSPNNLDGRFASATFSARVEEFVITIFTAPAPLLGEVGVRQKTAIRSWLRLMPCPRVVLLGQHPSLMEFAAGNPHVTVEVGIDFSFSGKAMFHGMVQRALRVQTGVVVMIDPELILLPHVSAVLGSLYELDQDWLLTGLPRTVQDFPYTLGADWLQRHGAVVEDAKVAEYVVANGNFVIGGVAQLWAWNPNHRPLHAGVMPPFIYNEGKHDSWLLGEAIVSGYRRVIDGTEALNAFRVLDVMASPTSAEDENESIRLREMRGNIQLASSYGSFHFRPSKLSDIPVHLVPCGPVPSRAFCIVNRSHHPCVCSVLKASPYSGYERGFDEMPRSRWLASQRTESFSSLLDVFQSTDLMSGNIWRSSVRRMTWTQKIVMFLTLNLLRRSPTEEMTDCGCNSKPPGRQVLSERSTSMDFDKREPGPYSLEFLVKKRANADKVVTLAVAGNSYRDMLMNWVCRLKQLNVSNFLVSAIDDDIYRFALQQGVPVFRSSVDVNVSRDDCHFGTDCFQKVTKMKSRAVLRVLQLGYHVLFSDVDVYWFQDPLKELMAFGPGHLAAQTDQWNETEAWNVPRRLNSGFYFAWSDNRTIEAFRKIVRHAAVSERSEQPSFYDVLCGDEGKYAVGNDLCVEPELNFTVHFLDPAKYPNGAFRSLWEKKNLRKVCEAQGCRVLHNNWVNGRKRKLERQVKSGLLEYDSTTRLCSRSLG